MKKYLFTLILLLLIGLFTSPVSAETECPSRELNCSEITSCADPCVKVVVRLGMRNVPGTCQCQIIDDTNCAKEGDSCLGIQCCSSAPYCWGRVGLEPLTCHTNPQTPTIIPAPTTLPVENPLGQGNCNQESLYTAIGCIPIGDSNSLIAFILKWAFGIGGGIAFLLIIYAGFMILTSSGNPDRLKAGQELLTSAIMGLILLIFSVFILRIIGVNILRIPGL